MKTTALIIAALTLACLAHAEEEKKNPKENIERLLQQSREAKEAGRMEEAQKLHGEAERIMAELKKHEEVRKPMMKEGEKHKESGRKEEKHPEGGKFSGKGPEAEKLGHMMQAVEHLRAAGMNDQAKGIEEAAQHLRHELEEHMKHAETEGRDAHAKKEGQHPGEKKAHGELDEMRQQMRKMAEQIEHLQNELKKR